jgi:predicted ribosomally synthesized peptide with nif11-like leader
MSLQTALKFIQRVRSDETLKRAIAGDGDESSLERVVQLAAAEGFTFTVEELRQAHKYDWGMRWARYRPKADRDSGEHEGDPSDIKRPVSG